DLYVKGLGGTEGIGDELGRIVRPGDDVDPLRTELAHDAADPHAPGTDARADRVDALLVGGHRHLGPDPGLARERPDDDRPRGQLGCLVHAQATAMRYVSQGD